MLVGPPIAEWLLNSVGSRPLVFGVDDAIWLPEQSSASSRLSSVRRWLGKVNWLIRHATLVTCGNRFIADHVDSLGARSRIVPNAVDTEQFFPASHRASNGQPSVVGWIGSHMTFPYLEAILPSLEAVPLSN
jgi:hypothetical protein